MDRQNFLKQVRKEIHFIFDRKQIEWELETHLNDSKSDLMSEGLPAMEAEAQAIAQMGDPKELGKLLNKEHHPIIGYIWSFSKVLLIATILLTIRIGYDSFQSALDILYPNKNVGVYRVEESHPIRLKYETRTHYIIIDHVCYTDTADYYITYRARTKFEYVRAMPVWHVVDVGYDSSEADNTLTPHSITEGQFGEKGYIVFKWPDNDILYLFGKNDEVIELDLGEYWK